MNEYARSTTKHLMEMRDAVQCELRRFSGVRSVGVGVRERHGTPTGELAFRVYVDRKRARHELARREIIPRRISGYRVDIHTMPYGTAECCGGTRPLLAGLSMSMEPFSTFTERPGTLGCFLSLPDGTEVALSNEHVLLSKGGGDSRVFQPGYKNVLGFTCNEIGNSISSLGHIDDFVFQGATHFIDCAVVDLAKVDFVSRLVKQDVSTDGEETVALPAGVVGSVKRNAQGQVTEIRNGANAIVDPTRILGSAPAELNSLVFKVGATTGLTVGRVADIAFEAEFFEGPVRFLAPNQIQIVPIAGHRVAAGDETFTLDGDSGSVYLNLENKVVGLHHHGRHKPTERQSFGSHIAPVLRRLGNQQASAAVLADDSGATHKTSAPSTALARELWIDAPAEAHNLDAIERDLRRRFSGCARGRLLLDLLENHMNEILRLVWNCRAVTVVWHRHHGPAFVVLFARALARPGLPLPREAGGIGRRALLCAMADVLEKYGSTSLKTAVTSVRPWLLDLLAQCRDTEELYEHLSEVAA